MKNFEIDHKTGQLSIVKGSSLDVNHLNEENINFNVEVSLSCLSYIGEIFMIKSHI